MARRDRQGIGSHSRSSAAQRASQQDAGAQAPTPGTAGESTADASPAIDSSQDGGQGGQVGAQASAIGNLSVPEMDASQVSFFGQDEQIDRFVDLGADGTSQSLIGAGAGAALGQGVAQDAAQSAAQGAQAASNSAQMPPTFAESDGNSEFTSTLTGVFPAQTQLTSDPRIVSLPRVTTSEPPVPNAGKPAISLVHVTKVYPAQPTKPALDDITVDIYTGEFVFLVGHSGSGKSTFIRLLNREIVATRGQIYIGGENLMSMRNWRIPYLRRNVGCVFQDFKLLPNKTTFENVAFALEVIGKSRGVIKTQVPEVLRLVGLQDKMEKYPDQLSGGEQQRVSIARAMVNRPPYLICDEPTGNLDPQTSLGIMRLLERINRTGTTVVVATHDREMVDSMRRRVIALENGHLVRDQDRGVYGLDV